MARAAQYKCYADYGPGGRKCPCCGPAPRERKRADRRVRRIEKRIARQEAHREVVEFMESVNGYF